LDVELGGSVSPGELDFEEVRRLLPQRFPLLLVDRVLECEPGKHLRAFKNVSGNDLHFLGHFPQRAILPGALVLEALAQACILLFQLTYGPLSEDEQAVFGSVKARFLFPVVPGDRLDLEALAEKMTSTSGLFEVKASVNGRAAVRGTLTMGKRTNADLEAARRGEGDSEPDLAGPGATGGGG
jgi:3-hydroxyacyl-[acyl-carrier-protein] dehydratase